MSRPRYLGISLEFASALNPEPGVKRAPTLNEQKRALDAAVTRKGGVLLQTDVSVRQNEGLDHGILAVIEKNGAEAIIFLTIDVLRRDSQIDIDLLQSIWDRTGRIDLLIEDVSLTDDASFDQYVNMVAAINAVRERDSSAEWHALIMGSDFS